MTLFTASISLVSMQVARDMEEQRKQFHTDTTSRLGRNELIVEQNAHFQSCILQVWACIHEFVCDSLTLKAWRRGACSRKPKQAHRKCSGHLNHSPVEVGIVAQEKPQYATRPRGWQHTHLLGLYTRIKQLIGLAGGARSPAPHKSCQLPDFTAVSGHFHREPADVTKRLPDIVRYGHHCLPNWNIAKRDSLFQRVTFSL